MKFRALRVGRRGRSFLFEIAVVVAGVLIALVVQELATSWRDRQRAAAVRASMHEEIGDFAEILRVRQLAGPCIAAKVDSIEALLARSGATGPWRNVGRPSYFFSSQGAWNDAAADLLSGQVTPETFRKYGELYQGMAQYGARGQREQEHWITLQSLERQDEPVTGERRWRLLEAVAGARNEGLILNATAGQMTALAAELGVAPNRSLAKLDVAATRLCRKLEATDDRTASGSNG
ncbi:MAG TPA: hypothetical protein VF605_02285 [Allosphingosinicella sp.]|jgi:hypothetical protein